MCLIPYLMYAGMATHLSVAPRAMHAKPYLLKPDGNCAADSTHCQNENRISTHE